jgi:AraC-like DNA-binding protein
MSHRREEIFEIDLSKGPRSEPWQPLRQLRLLALGTKVEPPGATFGPRDQYSWLLVWVRAGTVRFTVNGVVHPGEPGSVFLVPPGVVDSHDWSERERTAHSFIHFDFRPPARGWPSPVKWPLVRSFPESHPLLVLFEYVASLPRTAHAGYRAVILPMIELIVRMHVAVDVTEYPTESPLLPDLPARALGIIHRHVEESASTPLALPELAARLHVSPSHLCRVLKRSLGVGPMQCVQLVRLDKVVRLLERTELPVKQVAARTGFANAFHLSARFHHAFGMSPTEYRQARARGLQPRNFAPALRRLPGQRILVDVPAMRQHMARLRRSGGRPA